MLEKYITPNEYSTILQEILGQEVAEVYYITDCLVVFNAGKKVFITKNKNDELASVEKYEYSLRVWGHWKYVQDGKVVESTYVKPDEDAPAFRRRIGDFIETIHLKHIAGISVSPSGKVVRITLDSGGVFVVNKYKDTLVTYYNKKLDASSRPIRFRRAGLEEFTGRLQYSEAP